MLETIAKRERDFGTPARVNTEMVNVTIDDHDFQVPTGTFVMRAAAVCDGHRSDARRLHGMHS